MRIAILGYGKMGKTIEHLALAKGDTIVLKISTENIKELTSTNIQKADVAIEFSEPSSAFSNIQFCLNNHVPVVSGTTAWLNQLDKAKRLCEEQKGAFLYASNFSIGVNIFFQLNKQLAKMMANFPEYNVSMEEIHHTEKKDAPSGTALTLAKTIVEEQTDKKTWINAAGSNKEELSIISRRLPNVPGTHIVLYESVIDEIEIKHKAHSREGFAAGALLAARWIIGKEGCFGMDDVLKL